MANFLNRLVLYPTILEEENIEPKCIQLLQDNEFISSTWSYNKEDFYLAAKKFTTLLMFCGCAPRIQFSPEENGEPGSNFVAVKFISLANNSFYPGKNPFNYTCSRCKTAIPITDSKIADSISFVNKNIEGAGFFCPSCAHEYFYQKINWRRKAGFGKFFIEIRGIFESEALPSDELLQMLTRLTHSQWAYFYAQD